MHLKNILIGLSVFLIIALVVIISVIVLNKGETKLQNVVSNPLDATDLDIKGEITGYIFSSGLQSNLDTPYQITYINKETSLINPDSIKEILEGSFLIDAGFQIQNYWGKCVRVTGDFASNITQEEIELNYYRTTMTITSITPSNDCAIQFDESPSYEQVTKTYIGTLQQGVRPAPDINYDFVLRLLVPYTDENNATGIEQTVSDIYLVPLALENHISLTGNISKSVEVTGEWMTGFAESNFLLVSNVKLLSN